MENFKSKPLRAQTPNTFVQTNEQKISLAKKRPQSTKLDLVKSFLFSNKCFSNLSNSPNFRTNFYSKTLNWKNNIPECNTPSFQDKTWYRLFKKLSKKRCINCHIKPLNTRAGLSLNWIGKYMSSKRKLSKNRKQ